MAFADDVLELHADIAAHFGVIGGSLKTLAGVELGPFTEGVVTRETREPRRGKTDLRRRSVTLKASELTGTPVAECRVLFDGDASPWRVQEASPLAPAGTPIVWRLVVVDVVDRET